MNRARRSVVVAVVGAFVLVAGLGGVADAGAGKRVHGLHEFQSPSHNIGCVILKHYARCDIKSRDWKPPPAPKNCHLDYGQGLEVARHSKGHLVCAGDTALNPHAHVLAYGHSIRDGSMRCKSKVTGMTCRNTKTGHGFSLSRASYRAF